jgi:subtilisin family serine protease
VASALLLVAGLGMPVDLGRSGSAAPAAAAAAGEAAGPDGVLPADGRWTVTLLTGEVVEVWSDAEGRAGAVVRGHSGSMRSLRKPDGDLYVMPVRITPLLVDVLDHELFNVTGLVRQDLDDASIGTVPLIVQHRADTSARSAMTSLSTVEDQQPLPSIDAVAAEVPKGDAAATGELLAELSGEVTSRSRSVAGITRIWLDRRVTTASADAAQSVDTARSSRPTAQAPEQAGPPRPGLDRNLTQIDADGAWAAGLTGDGVKVAVLDTGVDAQHPDLAGRIVAQENFSASPDTVDRFGHGTHVAATIAGSGAAARGARRGVASDADLLIGKVLDDEGFGSDSEVIAGMEWAAPQADVVNMSLGGYPTDGSDPLSLALDALTEQHGTLFVVAAGNSGPTARTVDTPGSADRALTVGAVDGSDTVADFSSRGPLVDSNELKPEVLAPGVDVVAARASGTAMGEPVDANYTKASGTSMAAPHVAGAAAVLAQRHPDWNGDQLENALIGTTDPTTADGFDGGAGRIDVGDAIGIPARVDRDVVDVALADPRTEPHTEEITFTNTSGSSQTLALDVELEDRQRDAVHADAVSVAPAQLTVPAGGTGTATVSIDAPALDAGLYSGVVTADPTPADPGAAGEDDDVRVPVGVHVQPEMATLTIEATPPPGAGDDTPWGSVSIVNIDDFATYNLVGGLYFGESASIDIPAGRYAVVGDVTTVNADGDVVAQVGDPEVTVDGATTVAFDGSDAVPYTPTVEGVAEAVPVATNVGMVITPDAGTGGFSLVQEVYSWYPSPPVHVTEMEGDAANFARRAPVARLQAPPITARVAGSSTPVEVTLTSGPFPAEGAHAWQAVDVGDGQDLSAARGELAVVRLPADLTEREDITVRAGEAGVAVVAFVAPDRSVLTLGGFNTPASNVPMIAAAGSSASALIDAAAGGDDVTITVAGSPYVYDLVLPEPSADDQLDPDPVVDRATQRRLARLDERFYRDAGTEVDGERRRALSVSLMELDTVGRLPERRTAYVSPSVTWQSYVFGEGLIALPGWPPIAAPLALSITPETTYAAGSRQRLDWLRRPVPPGPDGAPSGRNFCEPRPMERTVDTMYVAVETGQDGRDRFTCNDPATSTLTLERDGTVVGTAATASASFPVPVARANYRLTYEQATEAPYADRSTTAWSFRSAGDPHAGLVRLPLVVVDYDLPLDTQNQPTSRNATFTARPVTGAPSRTIDSLRVWTSTDDGTTWTAATVRHDQGGAYRVTLPAVADGTGVSLKTDARDTSGSRIEQTLIDAYIG